VPVEQEQQVVGEHGPQPADQDPPAGKLGEFPAGVLEGIPPVRPGTQRASGRVRSSGQKGQHGSGSGWFRLRTAAVIALFGQSCPAVALLVPFLLCGAQQPGCQHDREFAVHFPAEQVRRLSRLVGSQPAEE
jgi:hypothetical protein